MRIREVSPDTVAGSWSDDLVLSKLWLIRKLKGINHRFGTVYILGSWYGNLSLLMLDKHLEFDKLINVDINAKALDSGDRMADKLGLSGKITSMRKDANELDYRQISDGGLVINTSCNNISGMDWFNSIPDGTVVALQGRDNDPGAVNVFDDSHSLASMYECSRVLYDGHIALEDPETGYTRYMLIGIK